LTRWHMAGSLIDFEYRCQPETEGIRGFDPVPSISRVSLWTALFDSEERPHDAQEQLKNQHPGN